MKSTAALVTLVVLALIQPAHAATAVVSGGARFEFLTPTLLRLEYEPSGHFIDAPTAVVQQRDWAPVPVQRHDQDGWLTLTSGAITVRYHSGAAPFTAANLEVSWRDASGQARQWHPGDVDAGNLGGLTYSLDNIAGANLPAAQMDSGSPVNDSIPGIDYVLPQAQPGLLSRSGYALIDDSTTPVMNANRTWVEPRPGAAGQDWYLFVYGRDFQQVLQQYAQLCGPIPMVPRYVLGPWITDFNFEYFPGSGAATRPDFQRYNQQYLMDEVTRLKRSGIPFDGLVLDFAWHNYGWDGGFDWSPLFPQPLQLMDWLHRQGVQLSLNDHPGYIHTGESILSYKDSHAPEVLAALGRKPPPAPTFDLDLSGQWSFATDSKGPWRPARVGLPWQEQGFKDFRGVGWYRTTVHLPQVLPPALYLYLGEVARTYQVFINGREAPHSSIHWPQRLTYTDLTPYITAAGDVELLLRVEADAGGEGAPARGGLVLAPTAIRDVPPPERIYFDLSNQHQAEVFMQRLHGPLMQQGVDVWWVDGGSGSVDMPGLNRQLWTNKVYYDYSQQASGKRAFILGRYGDWGSERYPGYFTGDTYSEWPVLAYEVAYSARGGNVLVPYISHDIGGFHGRKIDFELYARWIEFGAFSAILRMHSAHENPLEGNLRMPWVYGEQGVALMKKYFTLRTQLLPYLYTYSWQAHDRSLPLLRPLYLAYPQVEEAYHHPREYLLGESLLVAPVVTPGGTQAVYLPSGTWLDFFTGRAHTGGSSFSAHYATDATPLFVRAGAVIVMQPAAGYSNAKPADRLILRVYGQGEGSFDLYEDDGTSLAYDQARAHTLLRHGVAGDGLQTLEVAPTQGRYQGQSEHRSYQVELYTAQRPRQVQVNGGPARWHWDTRQSQAVIEVAPQSIRQPLQIAWR